MNPSPTVFVIDDDLSVLRSVEFLIEGEGFHVRAFTSGEEFLRYFNGDSRGCVVSDVEMPGMNGLELHYAIRRNGWTIPMILMSGSFDEAIDAEKIPPALGSVMRKPIDQHALIDRIRRAIQNN